MGLLELYYGDIYNERGEFMKTVWFPKNQDEFKYGNKAFHIDRENPSFKKRKGLLINKRFYYYNISCSDPLILNKKVEPQINPEIYNTLLESKVAKQLNDSNKDGLFKNLNPKTAFIGIAVIIGIILYLTGNLTP